MRRITVIISEQCNLDCSFCYFYPKSSRVLDIEAFLKGYAAYKKLDSERMEIFFFGGEPALQASNILKIIKNTEYDDVKYTIGTNLTYTLTRDIESVLERCEVLTSGDPISVRFQTKDNFELGKHNCEIIKPKHVAVVLTKDLLKVNPKQLFDNLITGKFNSLEFCRIRERQKLSALDCILIDDGLSNAYDYRLQELKVDIFENFRDLCTGGYSYSGDRSFFVMINPNGVVDLYWDVETNSVSSDENYIGSSIYELAIKLPDVYRKSQKLEKNIDIGCKMCNFYKFCNEEYFNLDGNIGFCTFYKKLFKKIAIDNNILL